MLRNMNKLISIITVAFLAVGCNLPVDKYEPVTSSPSTPAEPTQPAQPTTPGLALPTEIQISSEFSAEEQEGILEAIHDWSDRTYGAAKLVPVVGSNPDAPCQINPVEAFSPVEVHRSGRTTASGTHCNIQLATSVIELVSQRKWWVSETQSFRYEKGVTGVTRVFALQQLGTAFGIGTLNSGLMSEFYEETDDLDDAALQAFCSLHSCPEGFKADVQ